MTQYKIPHNNRHQFLKFGPRDDIFYMWCAWLESKGVPYEVGGGKVVGGKFDGDKVADDRSSWTIYKHQAFVEDFSTGKISRCCPMSEGL